MSDYPIAVMMCPYCKSVECLEDDEPETHDIYRCLACDCRVKAEESVMYYNEGEAKARAETAEAKLAALNPDEIVDAVWRVAQWRGIRRVLCDYPRPGAKSQDHTNCQCNNSGCADAITITETQLRTAIERAVKGVMG